MRASRLGLLLLPIFCSFHQGFGQVYEKLVQFKRSGDHPAAALVLGTDGALYGTTSGGSTLGTTDAGTIFKITADGTFSTLASFSGPIEQYPSNLIPGPNGSFYGTTREGGANGFGSFFKVSSAGIITTLFSFADEDYPSGGLVQGTDGNYYGCTSGSGVDDRGTVYRVSPTGTRTVLASFTGTLGTSPNNGLLLAADGNFYGATTSGGSEGRGTIFKMTSGGTLTTLVNFTAAHGRSPRGDLIQAPDGLMYGTTTFGGTNDIGTVFRVSPAGVLTTISSFTGANGSQPAAGLLRTLDGTLYGTTAAGGTGNGGTVFSVNSTGTLTTLASLNRNTGRSPRAPLIVGGDGKLYGTAFDGGPESLGSVFSVSTETGVTVVASFSGNIGTAPLGAIEQGTDGNFYGTTALGGSDNVGRIYRVTPTGSVNTIAEFNGPNGAIPLAKLLLANDGNFYGTTLDGGTDDAGTVFRVTPDGTITTVVSFNGTNGDQPNAALIQGADGALYGTTRLGGANSLGTIFKTTLTGTLTTLVNFNGTNGRNPTCQLFLANDGNYYGTTSDGNSSTADRIFRMTSAGALTNFATYLDAAGSGLGGSLIQANDGNFYGTAGSAGTSKGAIIRVTPAGVVTTVTTFTGANGSDPCSRLALGADGNLYGTTQKGGVSDLGIVFRVTTSGLLTTLFDFASEEIDVNPPGQVIFGSDGNIYGTALNSVYRLIYPGLPIIGTAGATNVTATTVELNGRVNARGSPTTITFEYSADGGATFPFSVGSTPATVNGYMTGTVTATLDELEPGRTYHGRIAATNASGTQRSKVQPFITLALPVLATFKPTNIATTSATFNASVNAKGLLTNLSFEYGTNGEDFPNVAVPTPATANGGATTPVTANVAGLSSGITYYYRLVGTSTAGAASSTPSSFTTLAPPLVTLGPAANATSSGATVTGAVDARSTSTIVAFEYGTNGVSFPNSIAAIPSPFTGSGFTPVTATIQGLPQGTTFFFRLRATSAGGITVSASSNSFTTLSLPNVSNQSANSVGSTTAALSATVEANDLDTSISFEYGPSQDSFPFSVTATPAVVTGSTPTAVTASIAGLIPESPYFFRVRATSSAGTTLSSPLNFTTSASARAVTAAAIATLGLNSITATLNGTVNGFGQPTTIFFQYGTTPNNLDQIGTASPGTVTGANDVLVLSSLGNLASGVTYYFRVNASNAGGTTSGEIQQFVTPAKQPLQAQDDYIFYSGQVNVEVLRNDIDPDANPPGDTSRLTIDSTLVQLPTVEDHIAQVKDNKTIIYQPETAVSGEQEDTIVYRVTDGFGHEATPTVHLIPFFARRGFYTGTMEDADGGSGHNGAISLDLGSTGYITTSINVWNTETYRLKGNFDEFGELVREIALESGNIISIRLQLGRTTKEITGTIVEKLGNGTQVGSTGTFVLTLNAGTGGLAKAGVRTAFVEAPVDLVDSVSGGYVVMKVAKSQKHARFVGLMPDGEPFSRGVRAVGKSFSLEAKLERGGVVSGLVRAVEADNGLDGVMSNFLWSKRAGTRSKYYQGNFDESLFVEGIAYEPDDQGRPPLDLNDSASNARLRLNSTIFGGPTRDVMLSIQPGGSVQVVGFDPDPSSTVLPEIDLSKLRLKFKSSQGTFQGQFRHPTTNKNVKFKGAFRAAFDNEPSQGRASINGNDLGSIVIIAN